MLINGSDPMFEISYPTCILLKFDRDHVFNAT